MAKGILSVAPSDSIDSFKEPVQAPMPISKRKVSSSEIKMDLNTLSEYSLFIPKSKMSLIQDYPELKKNPFLNSLRKDRLLFCWYLGCEGSPCFDYFNSDNKSEVRQAMQFAKKKSELKISDYEFQDCLDGGYLPADIRKGVDIFNSFRLGVRVRLKKMTEAILNNFEKIIIVDVDSPDFNVIDKDGNNTQERDYDKIKKYTDTCINIRNKFEEILQQAESGFGVSESQEDEKFEVGQSFIDLKHEMNK